MSNVTGVPSAVKQPPVATASSGGNQNANPTVQNPVVPVAKKALPIPQPQPQPVPNTLEKKDIKLNPEAPTVPKPEAPPVKLVPVLVQPPGVAIEKEEQKDEDEKNIEQLKILFGRLIINHEINDKRSPAEIRTRESLIDTMLKKMPERIPSSTPEEIADLKKYLLDFAEKDYRKTIQDFADGDFSSLPELKKEAKDPVVDANESAKKDPKVVVKGPGEKVVAPAVDAKKPEKEAKAPAVDANASAKKDPKVVVKGPGEKVVAPAVDANASAKKAEAPVVKKEQEKDPKVDAKASEKEAVAPAVDAKGPAKKAEAPVVDAKEPEKKAPAVDAKEPAKKVEVPVVKKVPVKDPKADAKGPEKKDVSKDPELDNAIAMSLEPKDVAIKDEKNKEAPKTPLNEKEIENALKAFNILQNALKPVEGPKAPEKKADAPVQPPKVEVKVQPKQQDVAQGPAKEGPKAPEKKADAPIQPPKVEVKEQPKEKDVAQGPANPPKKVTINPEVKVIVLPKEEKEPAVQINDPIANGDDPELAQALALSLEGKQNVAKNENVKPKAPEKKVEPKVVQQAEKKPSFLSKVGKLLATPFLAFGNLIKKCFGYFFKKKEKKEAV